MASRKPKVSNVGSNEQMLDGGSDDSKRSGGFDPLLGYGAVGGAALTAGYIAGKELKVTPALLKQTPLKELPKVIGDAAKTTVARQKLMFDYRKNANAAWADPEFSWPNKPLFTKMANEKMVEKQVNLTLNRVLKNESKNLTARNSRLLAYGQGTIKIPKKR